MLNIIGKRKIFLGISGLLVIASIALVGIFGLKQGIDFVGGTLWQVKIEQEASINDLRSFIKSDFNLQDFTITQEPTTQSFLLRMPETSEEVHNSYLEKLETKFGAIEELRFESIGPVIGQELRTNSIWAFILVLLTISLYVAFVFRKVSYPVSSWKYGIVTLVVAILVVIGFSVHDTIVVLDRTRENLHHQDRGQSFAELVNTSVNQTLARSINTSLTLIFILVAMYFLGPASLSYFILIILLGTLIGTYSSICVASSLIVAWQKE